MNRKKIFLAPLFLTILVLLGCEYNANELIGNPIDSKIIIETREILSEGSRNITLKAQTEKIYPCINYPIRVNTEFNEQTFKIVYIRVEEIDLCLTALGPATCSIDLGQLPTGDYWIELNNATLKNKGLLTVSELEIKLLFGNLKGIEVSRTNLKRVPAQTYWGTIGYHAENSALLVNQFMQKLTETGAVFSKQLPGDYWYYKIDPDGKILDTENHGYYFVKTIIFNYSANEEELWNLIKTGDGINKSELSINITSFKGEQFNNWSN